jgi:hypothetical protein
MKVTNEIVLAVLKHKYGADLVPTQLMKDKMQELLQYALRLVPADWQVMTLRDEVSMLETRIAFRDAEALEQAEEIDELKARLNAMPKQEPLSDDQIDVLRHSDNGQLNFVTLREFRVIARAVEKTHKIGVQYDNI